MVAALPLLVAAVTLNFVLVHLAPGDPVTYLVGDPGLLWRARPEMVEA